MPVTDARLGAPVFSPIPNPGAVPAVAAASSIADIIGRYADRTDLVRAPGAPPAARWPAPEIKLLPEGGLFLSTAGYFVTKPGQAQPPNVVELGNALYVAANRFAERDVNVWKSANATIAHKGLALSALQFAFNSTLEQVPIAGGFQNDDQRLQLRSCVAPLVLDLAQSITGRTAADAALKTRALQVYFDCLKKETHPVNRNFMITDLDRAKASLPAAVRPLVAELMSEVAEPKPAYGEWFKNGNNKLVVDYNVGAGFWEEETQFWVNQGFARRDNPDGTMTLTKELNEGGQPTKLELVMRNGADGIFEKMNDPATHIVVYSGHANYGRNVLNRLDDAPELKGAKVFFGLQCGGKYVHNAILDKWNGLQIVQSKNSSFGPEDRLTLLNSLVGFAKRQTWSEISDTNRRSNSDNYYFPSDALVRKKAEDRDHDGIIDAWDRVVQYNTFKPQAALDQELTAKDPGAAADRIDGRGLSSAVQRFLRIAGYNEWAEPLQNQRMVADGWSEGGPQKPLLELVDARDPDGAVTGVVINKYFAHASEGTLGAVLSYELGRRAAEKGGAAPDLAKASGLVMAAKCLDVDTNSLDQQIWRALLKFEGLPAELRFDTALAAAKSDEHMTAGTKATVTRYLDDLKALGIRL